jgi:hypothetical protein
MSVGDQEWHALCEAIAKERDPERMSRLLDSLIKSIDGRRQSLQNGSQNTSPSHASGASDNSRVD